MSRDVVLVDSGGANIASVRAALARLDVDAELTADADRIRRAERVILPGVGAAAPAMAKLREYGLVEVLRSLTQPLLGICLGMQLLYDASVEGGERVECLGLIPGEITALDPAPGVRIPHMGWNVVAPAAGGPLWDAIAATGPEPRAYFVHSYAAPVTSDTVATATHGRPFTAIARRGSVNGAQFHPERSGKVGAALLRAFVEGEA